MLADFSLQKAQSSSRLPRPLSRIHEAKTNFSVPVAQTNTNGPLTEIPSQTEKRSATPEQKQLESTQRNALLGTQFREISPKQRLENAVTHYKKSQKTAQKQEPTSQSRLEKLASIFTQKPDPNVQKFNDLHTLYATALPVCGALLRQLISEDDMQDTLETVWKTGKVDVRTLELFETAVLTVVDNKLTQES